MRAMILAAGFGTRLHPLTQKIPKALVPINGQPILEIILRKLERAGFGQVAVNAHYLSNQIDAFLVDFQKKTNMVIHYSYEPEILNTGGGIKKMLSFFDDNASLLVHNVDVLVELDYRDLYEKHQNSKADATLVVNKRPTSRPLAFSPEGLFIGRGENAPIQPAIHYGFCGIQYISPKLFRHVKKDSFYSIDIYEQEAARGTKIGRYDIGTNYWKDVGNLTDLHAVEMDIGKRLFAL